MEVYTIMAAKHFAIKALLKSEIIRLPITSEDIKNYLIPKGWRFVAFNLDDEKSVELLNHYGLLDYAKIHKCFSYKKSVTRYVFYQKNLSEREKIQVFAHELGHIEMGHFSESGVLGYTPNGVLDDAQEEEANEFTIEFLAPSCILKKATVNTLEEIHKNTLLEGILLDHAYTNVNHTISITNDEETLISKFKGYILTRKSKATKTGLKHILPIVLIASVTLTLLFNINSQRQKKNYTTNLTEPATATALPTPTAIVPVPAVPSEVVITSSGEKYHKPDCIYVKNKTNTVSLSIEEAINMGYESCEVCDPE